MLPRWTCRPFIVEMGSPAEVVLKAADDVTSDLIIIGAHGAGALPRVASHFGSVAHKIVCRAVCPVLTVRLTDRRQRNVPDWPSALEQFTSRTVR